MRLYIVDLDLMPYKECLNLQEQIVDARQKNTLNSDVFLLVEHNPVITFGVQSKNDHLKASEDEIQKYGIDLVKINRGGKATYHGPGQLVGYPIIKMSLDALNNYSAKLEQTMLHSSKDYSPEVYIRNDINPESKKRYVGIWYNLNNQIYKIGAVGVQIKNYRGAFVSMHGFAFNVSTVNLDYFNFIDPCGLKGVKVTSLERIINKKIFMFEFKEKIIQNFIKEFNYDKIDLISKDELMRIMMCDKENS